MGDRVLGENSPFFEKVFLPLWMVPPTQVPHKCWALPQNLIATIWKFRNLSVCCGLRVPQARVCLCLCSSVLLCRTWCRRSVCTQAQICTKSPAVLIKVLESVNIFFFFSIFYNRVLMILRSCGLSWILPKVLESCPMILLYFYNL